MHEHSDYLREQATKYLELAAKASDPVTKQEFSELAKVCEEVANDMSRARARLCIGPDLPNPPV